MEFADRGAGGGGGGGNVIPDVDNSHNPCAAAVIVAGVGDLS